MVGRPLAIAVGFVSGPPGITFGPVGAFTCTVSYGGCRISLNTIPVRGMVGKTRSLGLDFIPSRKELSSVELSIALSSAAGVSGLLDPGTWSVTGSCIAYE